MPQKPVRSTHGPQASRPRFPAGYGIPKTTRGMLPWSFVEEKMANARNYWVSTTRPDGTPHARPVDGVWVDGGFCFGGAPETRWVRNLTNNPAISVNLGSETDVVILEGKAEYVTDPKDPMASSVLEASCKKYPEYYPRGATPFRPFWMLRPRVVFAWTLRQFPASATKWVLASK